MKKKLRILHILQSNKFSGAENVVCEIIESFKESEFDMVYCSTNGSIKNILEERNIVFFPMKHISISEIRRVIKVYKPDLVHAHDFTASVLCSIAASCPVISHLHNNAPWIRRYSLKSFSFLISCFKYKKILVVSNSILDEYIFGNFIRKKTLMIGNPINIERIKDKSMELNEDIDSYDIVFVGRLVNAKDPLRFIDIIKELSKELPLLKVCVIGDGELRKQCEELIVSLGLNSVITMKGFLENPFPVLRGSKILCMTSKWEGFGLVAVESMILGLPVVSTNAGGLKNIVDDKCGMICLSNEEFCNELFKLLTDKVYLKKKSERAIRKAKTFNNILSYKEILKCLYLNE